MSVGRFNTIVIEGTSDEIAANGIAELERYIEKNVSKYPKFLRKYLAVQMTVTRISEYGTTSTAGKIVDMLLDAGYRFHLQCDKEGISHFKVSVE